MSPKIANLWIGVFVVLGVASVAQMAYAQTVPAPSGWVQKLLALLNDPQWKFLFALIGGQLMRVAPGIENRAIPAVLQGVNVLITVIAALFGVQFHPGIASVFTGVLLIEPKVGEVAAMGILGSLSLGALLDQLASVALASGVQSQIKNAAQWWKSGRVIFKKPARA